MSNSFTICSDRQSGMKLKKYYAAIKLQNPYPRMKVCITTQHELDDSDVGYKLLVSGQWSLSTLLEKMVNNSYELVHVHEQQMLAFEQQQKYCMKPGIRHRQ